MTLGLPTMLCRALSVFRRPEVIPAEMKNRVGDETSRRVIQCGGGQTWVDPKVGASWVDLKNGRR